MSNYSHNIPSEKKTQAFDASSAQVSYVRDMGEYPMSAEAAARLQAFLDPNHAEFHGHSFSENRIVNEVATKVNVDVPAEVALGIAVAVLKYHPIIGHQLIQPGFEKDNNRSKVHTQHV